MAGYVCTIAGGKGGVGKTTTAINLGAALAANDLDVVVVDADLGMANLGAMLGVENDETVHDVLAGNSTVSGALASAPGGLTITPGDRSLEAFAEADPAKLNKVITTLQKTFDVVLVDTGSGVSHETAVPLGLADGVVLVTTPDDVAISDTGKTADLAARVDGLLLGVLVTKVTEETDVEALAEQFAEPLLGVVPHDSQATDEEPLVVTADETHPADAYEQLATQLERVFFEGAEGDELERVHEESWFGAEDEQEDEDEEEESGSVAPWTKRRRGWRG